MTRQLLVALAIGLAGCGSRGCGPHQPLFYDSAVHIGVNARSTVLLDPALDGNGPGLPLHTAMIAAHTYDIRLNVSLAQDGIKGVEAQKITVQSEIPGKPPP